MQVVVSVPSVPQTAVLPAAGGIPAGTVLPVIAAVPAGAGASAEAEAAAKAGSKLPRDDVALAAARALGGGTGGINVVSTSPIALDNPINLIGGNYNKRTNYAGAAGR
ncbi:hypothetical protein GPECTOR_9g646 [Gonium pectorale]|uniref:Uncharacterized protein n=1 Tax=Gonium pectorale TaxID=33097 RepID=A0A150GS28_GONPE|nr:hypothetical protein GPECTOR_9g646 [Gonium pectorale]|eukprot:KXZ52601.1 hypothetical protein GPECTOR_9g646 [Gonium pectorale]